MLLQGPQGRSRFNILSVGSGSGEPDLAIVQMVMEVLEKNKEWDGVDIFNRAIEPNGQSLGVFNASLDDFQATLTDGRAVQFDLHEKTFQDYKADTSKEDSIKFDIIHFVHSIYYVDVEKALTHCLEEELNENGQVVCFVGDKDILYNLCLKQGHVWHGDKKMPVWMTAQDIIVIADKHGWSIDCTPRSILSMLQKCLMRNQRKGMPYSIF